MLNLSLILLVTIFLLVATIIFWLHYFRVFKFLYKKNNYKQAHPVKLEEQKKFLSNSLWKVNKVILSSLDFEKLSGEVVNVVLQELDYMKLGYRICVLTLVDKKERIVRRVSFSPTPEALEILKSAKVKFHEIKIPLSSKRNLLVKAIVNKKAYVTHDLSDVFFPEKTREIWRNLQHKVGIRTSLVFPLIIKNKSIGAMIFSLSKGEKDISDYEKQVLAGFTDAVAVALENAHLYRKVKKINDRLREVSALKDEFVSLTSHELRTPLTGIAGSLATVLDGYAGKVGKKCRDFLDGAHNETVRLIRLVNNLLNISRIEAKRLKFDIVDFSLSELLQEVKDNIQNQAVEKNLSLLTFYPDNLTVHADQDKVREILINLIGNAIKYTEKGEVKATVWTEDKFAIVAIEDTGKGILPQDQEKLFKKFERVSSKDGRKVGGTGLGLYICKNLLKGMSGDIWLESKHGKGSTFYFVVPAV